FDIVPQVAEEANFSDDKVKVIMDTSVIAGCFFYILMTFIAISIVPEHYSNWVAYVNDLNNLEGFNKIMTFHSAYKILGMTGLYLITAAAVCAVLTGILAFYIATSRLLYSMAREEMLPSWFGVLNKNGVPFNAIIFCTTVSILVSLLGRNTVGWTVDMASLGGAIGFGYTSLAAYKYSINENRKDVSILSGLGFFFSVIFALLLLVPLPGLQSSLAREPYIMLLIWIFMGVTFYWVSITRRGGGQAEK
ncbi:MAG: APC family permease, partial [Synergistaceae bacterium]|nr:APC family permease [Synergistaceae bacterium]